MPISYPPIVTAALAERTTPSQPACPEPERVAFVVFSGELDKLMAAFTMATGAAACGMDVTMFFTFWGTALLRAPSAPPARRTWTERLLGWMVPGGLEGARLSRLHMGGLGRWMMVREMRRKAIPTLDELVALARESGVRLAVCDTSLALMGMRREDLIDSAEIEVCGVATLWGRAAGGQTIFV